MRHTQHRDARRPRAGFTFLEVQVAFILLGIGLAGICPLVVMQLRLSRVLARANIQGRESPTLNTYMKSAPPLSPATPYLWPHPFDHDHTDRTYFLVPEVNPWYRRFGYPATLQTDPPSTAAGSTRPVNTVEFNAPATLTGDSVVVAVKIAPIPAAPPGQAP